MGQQRSPVRWERPELLHRKPCHRQLRDRTVRATYLLSRLRLALPLDEPSRETARRCAITIGDDARHNSRFVTVGLLQQAFAASGKIIGHVGPSESEPV